MTAVYLSDKTIKPRKPHSCYVCGERIEKGETCHVYRGIGDDGPFTSYFHHECWSVSRSWDYDDWYTFSPGDISREDVLAELGEAP